VDLLIIHKYKEEVENMKKKIINCIKIASPFVAFLATYMVLFYLIRLIKVEKYLYPSMAFDLKIPYIGIFVVPYLSWLIWMPFIWLYTLFQDEKLFKKISYMMLLSMSLYLVFSLICPTALELRPTLLNCKDIWCRLTTFLYSLTPETYVFPSLHVHHSLVALYAIYHGKDKLFQNKYFKLFGLIWTIMICLSTVFVKQHSMIDAGGGALLFLIILMIVEYFEKRKKR